MLKQICKVLELFSMFSFPEVLDTTFCIFWFQALSLEDRSAEVKIKDQTLQQFMLSYYDILEENSAKLFDEFGMKRSVL